MDLKLLLTYEHLHELNLFYGQKNKRLGSPKLVEKMRKFKHIYASNNHGTLNVKFHYNFNIHIVILNML
jgi:hypothetical protein